MYKSFEHYLGGYLMILQFSKMRQWTSSMRKEAGCRRVYTAWSHLDVKHGSYAQMGYAIGTNSNIIVVFLREK